MIQHRTAHRPASVSLAQAWRAQVSAAQHSPWLLRALTTRGDLFPAVCPVLYTPDGVTTEDAPGVTDQTGALLSWGGLAVSAESEFGPPGGARQREQWWHGQWQWPLL